jgi:sugar transferase EpsL
MSAAPSHAPAALTAHGKLHILIVDPVLRLPDQAGDTRSHDLARRFADAGHRVTVLTTTAGWRGDEVQIAGVRVESVRSAVRARFGFPMADEIGGVFSRALLWRLWSIEDVDAVLATDRPLSQFPVLAWFAWLRAIPLILDAREGPPERVPSGGGIGAQITNVVARALFRFAAHRAHQIVVRTPDQETLLGAQRIGSGKVSVAYPGSDTALFAAQPGTAPGAGTPALSAYPYLAQRQLVAYAGQMNAHASLERVIAMAAALQNQAPEVIFALCGDGPARGGLEARAVEAGVLNKNVWFLDPLARRDLPAFLGAASAVLISGKAFAGTQGADAGALFDALAAGRPVIAAQANWQRDIVDGRSAGLALPDAPEAAARELADYLSDGDGLRRASQQAQALAAGRFHLDRTASKVRGLIEEAVAQAPRAGVLRRRTLGIKRAFDVVTSLAMLIILSPLLIGVSIAIAVKMGWPVLFTQERPGLKGRPFRIYKFRTMNSRTDASGALLPDSQRLTAFGKFLRRFSIDEFPQLMNILKGDMSLIGPRPLLVEYMPYYTTEQLRRHDVLPGVTGWAQVNGRNAISWEEKFAFDVYYVDNISLWLDIKIMFKTAWTVLTGRGVSQEGHATFERFDQIMARRQGAEDV